MTRPCYLGASYLNCGWAWVNECSEYGSRGEDPCVTWTEALSGAIPAFRCPHLCGQCSPDMACPYAVCGRGRCIYPREDGSGCSLIQ